MRSSINIFLKHTTVVDGCWWCWSNFQGWDLYFGLVLVLVYALGVHLRIKVDYLFSRIFFVLEIIIFRAINDILNWLFYRKTQQLSMDVDDADQTFKDGICILVWCWCWCMHWGFTSGLKLIIFFHEFFLFWKLSYSDI